jgi:AcrR family transcriptional regulator
MKQNQQSSSEEKLIDAAVEHLNKEGLNNFTATSLTRSANLGYGTFINIFLLQKKF